MADQVWVEIGAGCSVGIDREEAMSLDRKGFAKLYRSTVCGSSRREAYAWADRQIIDRSSSTPSSPAPGSSPVLPGGERDA